MYHLIAANAAGCLGIEGELVGRLKCKWLLLLAVDNCSRLVWVARRLQDTSRASYSRQLIRKNLLLVVGLLIVVEVLVVVEGLVVVVGGGGELVLERLLLLVKCCQVGLLLLLLVELVCLLLVAWIEEG